MNISKIKTNSFGEAVLSSGTVLHISINDINHDRFGGQMASFQQLVEAPEGELQMWADWSDSSDYATDMAEIERMCK